MADALPEWILAQIDLDSNLGRYPAASQPDQNASGVFVLVFWSAVNTRVT